MHWNFAGAITLAIGTASILPAQTVPAAAPGADVRTQESIDTQAKELLAEAQKAPSGLASVTLEKYPGHLTMLTARVRDGGAEVHKATNDIFVAEDGEAIVVTGGTAVGAHETSPGEIRGVRVEGGTRHVLHKGDVIHISPGVPHQTLVPGGKTFIYYVIKVDAPALPSAGPQAAP